MPNKNKIKYLDELTCDQIECYRTLRIFEDLKKASGYATKTGGQIYTQVDGDTDVLYSKGIALSTGPECMQWSSDQKSLF